MKITSDTIWIAVGFIGQAAFFGRFLLQWIHSEKLKESAIPVGFWYFSIVGSAILLAYVIHRRDPVLIVGQSTGFIIYLRNLQLIRHKQRREQAKV